MTTDRADMTAAEYQAMIRNGGFAAPVRHAGVVLGIDPGYTTGFAATLPGEHRVLWAETVGNGNLDRQCEALERLCELHTPSLALVQVPCLLDGQSAPFFAGGGKHSPMSVVKNALRAGVLFGICLATVPVARMVPSKAARRMKEGEAVWRARWSDFKGRVSEHARDAANLTEGGT